MSVAVVPARRRKPRVSGDSEEFSEDSYDDNDANKGSEGDTDLNASSEGLRESEYETLDEAGESESDETTAIDDEREEELSDSVIIEYEREEGDGQESVPPKEKKLDDDEDRRNPQYIPKRGTFYEHDDRTAVEDVAEETVEKESERTKETEKKKVWKEQENRWSHDRYNEDDQAPKSRDELIAIYGYDIRNEDAPPRARRRRKYGRGPNKYTRNWEDEDAYGKPGGVVLRGGGVGRRGGRGGMRKPFGNQPPDSEEEFPPLNNTTGGRGFKSDAGISKSEVSPSSQMRGTNRSSFKGRRSGSFQSQSRDGVQNTENKDEVSKEETSTTSTTNASNVNSPWKNINNQNKIESVKVRDDVKKPIRDKSVPSSSNANSNSFSKSRPMGDEKKEMLEENGWKPRRDRSKPRAAAEDTSVVDSSGSNSGWRGKSRGDRRGMPPMPVESLTFTPSASRGRGRGQRGGGIGRQSMQFKPIVGSDKSAPPSRRSLSETRITSQDQSNSAEGPYIKSQIVNRTADDMVKELGRVTINEHQPTSNRDYARKPTKSSNNYHQVPPRMQESAANKPKRYSSQRQRSLPETGVTAAAAAAAAVAAYAPPHGYYPQAGYAQPPEEMEGMGVVSSGYVQPPPVYGEAQQPPLPPPVVAQPPATTPPLGLLPPPHPQAPPAYATPPFSSPPTFIPPPVAGPPPRILPPGAATYMTAAPTGAPIINYVATPPQNQFAPQAFAPFQGYTAVPAAPPPPELYQPQGITYYSPEEQVMSRPITQKRQSTAIPIVPPPEKGPRGRGRLREEASASQSSLGVMDVGAAGDATSSGFKMVQVEDATDGKKVDLELQQVVEYEESHSAECDDDNLQEAETVALVQKNSVSPNIIDEINITEIPESAEAVEAAKSIEAAASKSSEIKDSSLVGPVTCKEISKTVVTTTDDIAVSNSITPTSSASDTNSEANISALNTSSTEQEIQA